MSRIIHVLVGGVPHRLESPVWLMMGKYALLRTPHEPKARGLLIGGEIHNLRGREPLGDYPEAKIITTAEYLEAVGRSEPDPDPELTPEQVCTILMGGKHETE